MLLGCKSYAFVWLFYKLDVVAFVGVVVSVFVLAKVLQQVVLVFLLGDADEHFSVGHLSILQIALEGIVGRCLLVALLALHQLECR